MDFLRDLGAGGSFLSITMTNVTLVSVSCSVLAGQWLYTSLHGPGPEPVGGGRAEGRPEQQLYPLGLCRHRARDKERCLFQHFPVLGINQAAPFSEPWFPYYRARTVTPASQGLREEQSVQGARRMVCVCLCVYAMASCTSLVT